jgi:hypothetical protein
MGGGTWRCIGRLGWQRGQRGQERFRRARNGRRARRTRPAGVPCRTELLRHLQYLRRARAVHLAQLLQVAHQLGAGVGRNGANRLAVRCEPCDNRVAVGCAHQLRQLPQVSRPLRHGVRVDFDRHKLAVNQVRHARIGERLAAQSLAAPRPVRAQLDQHQAVAFLGASEGVLAARQPVDQLVLPTAQVGFGAVLQGVRVLRALQPTQHDSQPRQQHHQHAHAA